MHSVGEKCCFCISLHRGEYVLPGRPVLLKSPTPHQEMDTLTLRLRCSHTYTGAESERGRRVWTYANAASSLSMLVKYSRNANAPLLKCIVGFANGE